MCPYGLYCEQLSGTAFTAPRESNKRSWLYRIRPSVVHRPFQPHPQANLTNDFTQWPANPNQVYCTVEWCRAISSENGALLLLWCALNGRCWKSSCILLLQMRWKPFDIPQEGRDFIEVPKNCYAYTDPYPCHYLPCQGLSTVCGAGDTKTRDGVAVHVYTCNKSMGDKCFYNADGDFLIGKHCHVTLLS